MFNQKKSAKKTSVQYCKLKKCLYNVDIRSKRERKMMNKTIQNAVKRIKQNARIAKAYDMPIQNVDLKKNDENVKKFFESLKK